MTINLPQHIESSIQAAVHDGHFASVDDAMTEAARLLCKS
jgi:Arc/MetJ-type ribon-helix-helix transcriptional regulator